MSDVLIDLEKVSVWIEENTFILSDISWTVRSGEHWAVLGPNGSGKTTLVTIATARRYPSRGSVEVLGRRFGESSMLELREQIAIIDPNQKMYDWFTVEAIVLTGVSGTVQPQWDRYSDDHRVRAQEILEQLGCGGMGDREIKSCSQGEQQRVRIARALMSRPKLVVFDEPASGLDLAAREALIGALIDLAQSDLALGTVMISHHFEELPPTITHAMLLRDGRIFQAGLIDDVVTNATVSATFGIPVSVRRDEGRWSARGVGSWTGSTSPQV